MKDYYKKIDFSIFKKIFDLYFDNLKNSKTEKERYLWASKFYAEYLQTIEIFFLNIFAITDNDLYGNLFLGNKELRDKIKERFYGDKKFINDVFLNYFLDNWIFGIKEKDRISDLEDKKRLYKTMIKEIVKDYLADYELLNSFKHGLRMHSSGKNSIWIKIKESFKSFKIGGYNTKIFYLTRKGEDVYEGTFSFNWERVYQKCLFLINILENTQKILLHSGEIELETLFVVDRKVFSKHFGTFRSRRLIGKYNKKLPT